MVFPDACNQSSFPKSSLLTLPLFGPPCFPHYTCQALTCFLSPHVVFVYSSPGLRALWEQGLWAQLDLQYQGQCPAHSRGSAYTCRATNQVLPQSWSLKAGPWSPRAPGRKTFRVAGLQVSVWPCVWGSLGTSGVVRPERPPGRCVGWSRGVEGKCRC